MPDPLSHPSRKLHPLPSAAAACRCRWLRHGIICDSPRDQQRPLAMARIYLLPFRIISLSFWRIASMSGSAKAVSSVLTPFVFALVPLMALSSWAWLISPGGPWAPSLPLLPSLPRGMPKVKRTLRSVKAHAHRRRLAGVQRGHAVHHGLGKGRALRSVVSRRALGSIAAVVSGRALAVAAVHPVVPTRDVEGEAHIRSIKAHAHRSGIARVHGVHRIHHRLRKGRSLLAHRAFLPLRDFKGEVQRVSHHTHARIRRSARRQGVRAVHLRGIDAGAAADEVDDSGELTTKTVSVDVLAVLGPCWVERHKRRR
jgi:hypothetical protein